jgi:tRNA(Ile)-lysidine synthase
MAGSATRRKAEPGVVAVAVSGGRDSTALLHASARTAASLGLRVIALHVHHGLQPQADAWLAQVRARCRRLRARGWPVAFASHRLQGAPSAGDSIEAWARRERYAALAAMAKQAGATLVLLAHHRRDQAETFLLQALRGAGPAGLAAMPRRALRDGLTWARPWLDAGDEAIDAYLAHHRLRHVDDPSNADPCFARSRLRCRVMPVLRAEFADAEVALAAAARRAYEARRCLDEVADDDLAVLREADGALVLDRWRRLAPGRAANALRAWLGETLGRGAPQTLVQRLLDELASPAATHWPVPGGGMLERHRGRLRLAVAAPRRADGPAAWPLGVLRPGRHHVSEWGGTLVVRRAREGGVALDRLGDAELRPRRGGERFQLAPGATPRSLKKQFQALGVPQSARGGPLLYGGGELVFVAGLGIDARARAAPGEPQVALQWIDGA